MAKELNRDLVNEVRKKGVLRSQRIIEAFMKVDRRDFVPKGWEDDTHLDTPVPIPGGMTTSQPSTIAFMLEILNPRPSEKILEIGTGSGYVTALLAQIVGEKGEIHSVEVLPELNKFASENLKKYKFKNTKLYLGDGKKRVPHGAPYEKIISGAEVPEIPDAWNKQLKNGGIIVTPFDNHVLKATKVSENKFKHGEYPYFRFIKMA